MNLEVVFVGGGREGFEPGVVRGDGGQGLVRELLDKLHLDSLASLRKNEQ